MKPNAEEGAGTSVRIIIVDDHPVFRFGLRELINQEEDLVVCGEAEDYSTGWSEIERLKPDMVLVDISLKRRDGISLVREIGKYYPDLPVLVVSMHDENQFAKRSLQAGAKGYIMKEETLTSIVKAIRCILEGKIYLSERLKDTFLTQFAGGLTAGDSFPVSKLSDRELEVYRFIGMGLGTNEIAQKLNLSIKTIGCYRERIKEKLELKSANELIRNAIRWVEHEQFEKAPGEKP
jgi:DNA-binding NarL/FixJ family response regulator